jgi:hypothetical protein
MKPDTPKFLLHPTPESAEGSGFASFNGNPHLAVEIPDGGFTITARTSEGKRVTFAFQPYMNGGPPRCIDVTYHDNGTVRRNGDRELPTFDTIIFNGPHGYAYDSRTAHKEPENKPGIVCILMHAEGNTV